MGGAISAEQDLPGLDTESAELIQPLLDCMHYIQSGDVKSTFDGAVVRFVAIDDGCWLSYQKNNFHSSPTFRQATSFRVTFSNSQQFTLTPEPDQKLSQGLPKNITHPTTKQEQEQQVFSFQLDPKQHYVEGIRSDNLCLVPEPHGIRWELLTSDTPIVTAVIVSPPHPNANKNAPQLRAPKSERKRIRKFEHQDQEEEEEEVVEENDEEPSLLIREPFVVRTGGRNSFVRTVLATNTPITTRATPCSHNQSNPSQSSTTATATATTATQQRSHINRTTTEPPLSHEQHTIRSASQHASQHPTVTNKAQPIPRQHIHTPLQSIQSTQPLSNAVETVMEIPKHNKPEKRKKQEAQEENQNKHWYLKPWTIAITFVILLLLTMLFIYLYRRFGPKLRSRLKVKYQM